MKKDKKEKDREVDKSWMPFSPRLVEEKKYHKYKDMVVMLGLGVQIMKSSYDSEMERRICAGLSDREIAELLGLEQWEVRKIRTVRETEITEGIIDRICEDSLDFKDIGPGIEDALKLYKSLVK
jgi:DNA-binding Xre family transcriptional regulator